MIIKNALKFTVLQKIEHKGFARDRGGEDFGLSLSKQYNHLQKLILTKKSVFRVSEFI